MFLSFMGMPPLVSNATIWTFWRPKTPGFAWVGRCAHDVKVTKPIFWLLRFHDNVVLSTEYKQFEVLTELICEE